MNGRDLFQIIYLLAIEEKLNSGWFIMYGFESLEIRRFNK